MEELLNQYLDNAFLDSIVSLTPVVGVGVLVGIIFAVLGWTFGLLFRIGKLDL